MKSKTGLIVMMFLLTGTVFVVADYFGLFGISEKPEYVLLEVKIRAYDKRDNTPIEGLRVRCFQQNNRNACTQRDSGKLGVVSVIVWGK